MASWPLVALVAFVAVGSKPASAGGVLTVAGCQAVVRAQPRSLEGYECLLSHRFTAREEVLRFLERRLRASPKDPRPRLYRALVHYYAGDKVDEGVYAQAARGFAREKDVAGEVHALTAHVSARCVNVETCDAQANALLERAGDLAAVSGQLPLRQRFELWRMKVAVVNGDFVSAAASEASLHALGELATPFLKIESLQLRAYMAARGLNDLKARALSLEMLDSLAPEDPRRLLALGGVAAASVHRALRGLESRADAERLLRDTLARQEAVGLALWYPRIGYLPARVQLALLLGPGPESFALLRSALAGYRARQGWTNPVWAELVMAELLATADPPDLGQALQMADRVVAETSDGVGNLSALVLRARLHFRLGRVELGRADGRRALEVAEALRNEQSETSMRLRYAESLSFAYRAFSGALLESRGLEEPSSVDEAFQAMERLRARGLMETLLAEERREGPASVPGQLHPGRLADVQAELRPDEALLSFQVWRPEPTMDAPFREGSSWLTVVTRDSARIHRIPNEDVLEPQVRAWTGLLQRRDGSDRSPGARLRQELLGSAVVELPAKVRRLIVVPDGGLHRLPFDALSEGPGTPYLAQRYEVSIVPSASLWLRLRATPRLSSGKLLVLADPSGPSDARAVPHDRTEALRSLVHARREAEVALSAFPAGSELRTGPAASEAFLKRAGLAGVSILHFATHALADEQDPERAAVVLAAGSPAEDGRLEPREIARLGLGGRTVVLAGCETSAGPVFRGEGVMSLARAFFSAGATAVVGTLDRVHDDEAAAFFTLLYGALGRGATLGEAVGAAKREAIRRGAPPASWAGVVLLGDSRLQPHAPEPSFEIPLGLAEVGLALVVVGAARRWRRI